MVPNTVATRPPERARKCSRVAVEKEGTTTRSSSRYYRIILESLSASCGSAVFNSKLKRSSG